MEHTWCPDWAVAFPVLKCSRQSIELTPCKCPPNACAISRTIYGIPFCDCISNKMRRPFEQYRGTVLRNACSRATIPNTGNTIPTEISAMATKLCDRNDLVRLRHTQRSSECFLAWPNCPNRQCREQLAMIAVVLLLCALRPFSGNRESHSPTSPHSPAGTYFCTGRDPLWRCAICEVQRTNPNIWTLSVQSPIPTNCTWISSCGTLLAKCPTLLTACRHRWILKNGINSALISQCIYRIVRHLEVRFCDETKNNNNLNSGGDSGEKYLSFGSKVFVAPKLYSILSTRPLSIVLLTSVLCRKSTWSWYCITATIFYTLSARYAVIYGCTQKLVFIHTIGPFEGIFRALHVSRHFEPLFFRLIFVFTARNFTKKRWNIFSSWERKNIVYVCTQTMNECSLARSCQRVRCRNEWVRSSVVCAHEAIDICHRLREYCLENR